jgi:spore maturation protein CgeB
VDSLLIPIVALVMMFTRHPSYIPFELMACKSLVVTNDNPANHWLLHNGENCLLSHASATSLCETMKKGLIDAELRKEITSNAFKQIETQYSSWDKEIEKIYQYMIDINGST